MSFASEYVVQGMTLVAIPTGQKGPTAKGWNKPENAITDPDRAASLSQELAPAVGARQTGAVLDAAFARTKAKSDKSALADAGVHAEPCSRSHATAIKVEPAADAAPSRSISERWGRNDCQDRAEDHSLFHIKSPAYKYLQKGKPSPPIEGWYPVLGYPATGFRCALVTRSVHHPAYAVVLSALVEARKAAGMHQATLAARLGRPQSFVSKFEKGERRLDVVEFVSVCQALAADPSGILSDVADRLALEPIAL